MQTNIKKLIALEGLIIIWLFLFSVVIDIFLLHFTPVTLFLVIYPGYLICRFTHWAIKILWVSEG